MSLRNRMNAHRAKLYAAAQDLKDPASRRQGRFYTNFYDHGILRSFWTNFFEIAPGVFRSNQPDAKRIESWAKRGIKTVINLRGKSDNPPYLFEAEACAKTDLHLIDLKDLSARSAPPQAALLALVDTLREAPKPFVFHCKSGADRTSLAAAIYLLVECDAPLSVARKQFSPRYIHFKWTQSGVLDHILDLYEEEAAVHGISFETWLRNDYDAEKVQSSFDRGRK